MTEIKVECDCGQRFKFDVEPVHGRMPFPVACPNCGADATEKANTVLQGIAAEATQPAPTPEPPKVPGLSISRPPEPAPSPVQHPLAPPSRPMPAPARPPMAAGATVPKPKPQEKSNFVLGTIGAVIAGVLAMLAWYFLIKLTGYTIGYAAWGVGVLTGAGARTLSGNGSKKLGIIAGACAFLAIIGGQFLYVKTEVDKVFASAAGKAYESRMAYAREAANAQTDDELKALIIKHEDVKNPTPAQIKAFREEELPKLEEFSHGKPSQEEFMKSIAHFNDSLSFKFEILKDSLGAMTILFLFLGVGSAYKLGASTFGASIND